MHFLAPPPLPPHIALGENDELRRVHLHLWQIAVAALTIFLTTWFCTLGPIPAIISLMIGKHILVAILLMGLGVDKTEEMRI